MFLSGGLILVLAPLFSQMKTTNLYFMLEAKEELFSNTITLQIT